MVRIADSERAEQLIANLRFVVLTSLLCARIVCLNQPALRAYFPECIETLLLLTSWFEVQKSECSLPGGVCLDAFLKIYGVLQKQYNIFGPGMIYWLGSIHSPQKVLVINSKLGLTVSPSFPARAWKERTTRTREKRSRGSRRETK